MSEKHKEAKKLYWASLSPEVKKERMSAISKSGHKKKTFRERQLFSLMMHKAKREKNRGIIEL